MGTEKQKIVICGVDFTDYVEEQNRQSMEEYGEPDEFCTPSDLLEKLFREAKTKEERMAVRDEYAAHPEKYPGFSTCFQLGKLSYDPKDVLAMLNEMSERNPYDKIPELFD